jgi:hypothetical protein
MKKSFFKVFVGIFLLLAACAEDSALAYESKLLGFWEYQTMTVNGNEKEFSNYLHISADKTYGQCYLTGSWELKGNNLKLKLFERETSYQIVHLPKPDLC